jgi:predicted nucleic acid-binding protein
MMVAESGPLIAFARIGRLNLLRQVVGELVIPAAVYEELTGRGHERPGAAEVVRGEWIQRRMVGNQAMVTQLPAVLHAGEREAIVLAEELQAQLLIDEQRGRNMATARGVTVLGSLRILIEAKRRGLIDRAQPLLDAMLAAGYWIDEELLPPFFQEIGEQRS